MIHSKWGWGLFILVLVCMVGWSIRPRNQGSLVRGSLVALPAAVPFATFTPTTPDINKGVPEKQYRTQHSPLPIPIPLESAIDRGRWEYEKRVLREIESLFCSPNHKTLFLENETYGQEIGNPQPLGDSTFLWLQEQMPLLKRDTWQDYVNINAVSYRLPSDLPFRRGTYLGSRPSTDKEAMCGRLIVSRVGFNQNGTQALLYYQYTCGSRCGGSEMVLLERNSGGWQVIAEVMRSIS
jgi:hypothetical protein